MEIVLAPFLSRGKVDRQRMNVAINGRIVTNLVLDTPELNTYSFVVRQAVLSRKNRIVLDLPDAASPEYLEVGTDARKLGVTIRSLSVSKSERQ